MRNWYKKFRRKYRILHVLLMATAIVMFWRGVWGLLDVFLIPHHELVSSLLSIFIAFIVLYIDDFHLRELE